MERVRRGQPVTAVLQNEIIQAIERKRPSPQELHRRTGRPLPSPDSAITSQAWNSGEDALERFTPVAIKGQPLTGDEGLRGLTVEIGKGTVEDDLAKFAVCMDNFEAGKTGYVCIFGVCWVKVDGGSGNYAKLEAGNIELTVGSVGPAQILDNPGEGYALIRFPTATSTEGSADQWYFVPNEE